MQAGGQRFDPAILHQVILFADRLMNRLFRKIVGLLIYILLLDNRIGGFDDSRASVRVIGLMILTVKSGSKGAGRMPWLWEAMKDVASCDKPRERANIF